MTINTESEFEQALQRFKILWDSLSEDDWNDPKSLEANELELIAGAISGTLALVFVYFGLNKITKIIPLGTFFRISSILLLLLSVYFGYEGVKELYAGLHELKLI